MNFQTIFSISITLLFLRYDYNCLNAQDNKADKNYKIDSLKFQKLVDNMNFPEGPAWDGKSSLFASSCYGGFIVKITGDEHRIFLDSLTGPIPLKHTNGLTFGKDGNLFACDYGRGSILRISSLGKVSIYASGYEGKPFNRPNDLAFDISGNLYFSDPKSYGKDTPDGRVFRIDSKTKKVMLAAQNICYPNGIAFSPDSKYLFLCESAQRRILRYKVAKDGSLINKEVFIELPGGDPDGIAFDVKGNLYAAHFGGGAIYKISSKGKIITKIPTPGKKPSNIEFGGKDMKTLFLTEDETNSIYKIFVETAGRTLFYSPEYNK